MKLYPALLIKGRVLKGSPTDSHNTIGIKNKVDAPESSRGFTTDGVMFLDRFKALNYLKEYDFATYKKLSFEAHKIGLHSEFLADAYGIEQNELAQKIIQETKEEKMDIDLKNKKVLVWDRGLYPFLAQKLGESFGKVYYYMPQSDPYPKSLKTQIGIGLPEIERVYNFWEYVDKVDCIVFFDCYDGDFQHWLRQKGYKVFGSGKSEIMEMDKVMFLEELESVGLPIPETWLAQGLDDLENHLKKLKGTHWLKTLSYYRGDFETKKFRNMKQITPWLRHVENEIGGRSKDLEVLIQSPIDAACEAGYDGFCIDGKFTSNCLVGYEIKDAGLVCKVFEETPKILSYVNDKMSPIFKKYGYRGHYSTEIRITDGGIPFFIDPTCRAPSPPAELMCELYENYAEAVWLIANGIVPELKPKAMYGAEIILTSPCYGEGLELCVEFPKEIAPFVKLKNHRKDGNSFYCIPNDNGAFFGAVVAYGNSVEQATKKALSYIEMIEADELTYDKRVFDEANKQIQSGNKFGMRY